MAKSITNRFGWLMVLGATLTMSDYSLYFVARHLGTPVIFAILGGVIFDGAAILFADYSLKHARVGSSGFGPRLGVLICAGLSAYLNSQHAVIAHQIAAARVFWAAPPLIAVAAYEFHIKWERRKALANAGRVSPDLPAFGRWAWALFPIATYRIARSVIRYRLGLILARQTPGMVHPDPPVPLPGYSVIPAGQPGLLETTGGFGQTPGQLAQTTGGVSLYPGGLRIYPPLADADSKTVRAWARTQGLPVPERGPLPTDICNAYRVANEAPAIPAVSEPVSEPVSPEPAAELKPADPPTITEHPDDNRGYL